VNEPKLGEWITVDHKLKRVKTLTSGRWTSGRWVKSDLPQPVKAMFLGKRTLANGTIDNYVEDGSSFNRKESVPAWLVVMNTRNKPFYVMPGEPRE